MYTCMCMYSRFSVVLIRKGLALLWLASISSCTFHLLCRNERHCSIANMKVQEQKQNRNEARPHMLGPILTEAVENVISHPLTIQYHPMQLGTYTFDAYTAVEVEVQCTDTIGTPEMTR